MPRRVREFLSLFALLAAGSAIAAGEVRILKFGEAKEFRMGTVVSRRIVSPDMGAKRLTLNFSQSQPGNEFAQHTHGDSDDTILIFEGEGDLRQGTTKTRFRAGQAAFVPGGQVHGTITAGSGQATMISFQTPPDMALYTGARDSSRPGAAAPQGAVTPGAVKYVDFASQNGFFVHPGMGAARVAVAHWKLPPGKARAARVAAGAEQILFVWQGSLALRIGDRCLSAAERDAVFASGPEQIEFTNNSGASAIVIQAISPAPPAR
jgi:quercetin dioxygenase-like cupin family protein